MGCNKEVLIKISRPSSNCIYPRTDLYQKLGGLFDSPALWVSGPPGSGKTTLISSYIEAAGRSCIWYQVDESDDDIASFFWYLRTAVCQVSPPGHVHLPVFTSAYKGGLRAFALRFFEQLFSLLPKGFVIVLDDFHRADSGVHLHPVICDAISRLPGDGNMVLISRAALPAEFCRLLGNELLKRLGWSDLHLTPKEVRGMAAMRRTDLGEELLDNIASQVDGWAAGLIFRLENIEFNDSSIPVTEKYHEVLFGYFANEVLKNQDAENRKILLQLSLFPAVTEEMAIELTGRERGAQLLRWLHRNNYFVSRQSLAEPSYGFHPLFRDFLLDQLAQEYSVAELKDLHYRAAAILEAHGLEEAACHLYRKAGAWSEIARVVAGLAPAKYRQGRVVQLANQIQELPEQYIAENPWLSYWLGMSLMFLDARRALQSFENAFARFVATADHSGSLAAWAGGVNAMLGSWDDVSNIDSWLDEGERLLSLDSGSVAEEIEDQAIAAMCFATFICRPQSPELPVYARKTDALLLASKNRSFRLMGCNLLLIFYSWLGDLAKARILLEAVARDMETDNVSDVHQIMWSTAKGWYQLAAGNTKDVVETVSDTLLAAQRSGVHLFDYKLFGMGAQANLLQGNESAARGFLHRYAEVAPGIRGALTQFHLHFLFGWERWASNEFQSSLEHLDTASGYLNASGSPPIVTAKMHLAYATLSMAMGHDQQACALLDKVKTVAKTTRSAWLDYHRLLLEADMALRASRLDECNSILKQALSLAHEHHLVTTDWWDPRMMSRLLEVACRNDIESEYVQKIIRIAGLQPESEVALYTGWPLPIKIELLGQFRLSIDGRVVESGSKNQKKVLELLKFLAAHGGERLTVTRVADMIWPDSDGDGARNALKTTVHRLRKLTGSHQAVVFKAGVIGLSPIYCWSDCRAFTFLAMTSQSNRERCDYLERALLLYKGTLLPDEEAEPSWLVGARAKFQRLAHGIALELGDYYESKDSLDNAIDLYRSFRETDPLNEQFVRRLISCYHQLGKDSEALNAYRECCGQLDEVAARMPSRKTQLLVESIIQQ